MCTDTETDGLEMRPTRAAHKYPQAPTTLSEPESGSKEGDSEELESPSRYVLT